MKVLLVLSNKYSRLDVKNRKGQLSENQHTALKIQYEVATSEYELQIIWIHVLNNDF